MAQYASLMPEYAWIYLNAPQYAWKQLNIAECPWICLNKLMTMPAFSICLIILDIWQGFQHVAVIKYSRVLNVLQYGYNTIIVANNVIILEFLPAWFVHPFALQPTILSFLNKSSDRRLTKANKVLIDFFNELLGVFLKSHSHLPKIFFIIYFNGSSTKMMKNAFYFILKAFFVLKIFKFLSWLD